MPPARKGRVEWGHLAGAWEPDDFRSLREAGKLKLSRTGEWGAVVQGRSPQGHLGGTGGGALAQGEPSTLCDLSLFPC